MTILTTSARTLGAAFAVALLAGCGASDDGDGGDPGRGTTADPTAASTSTAPVGVPQDSDVAVAPALDPGLADVGRAVLAFARGQEADVPAADEIELFVRGNPVSTIAAADADDPTAWEICTNEDGSCSSPLDQVGLQDGPFDVTGESEVTCVDHDAPAGFTDVPRVLLEASPSDCRSYAALAVYVTDGDVVAVDLLQ
ncbi:hypothetical protein GCM10023340_24770 [Nocardioides marinquilinus]|uniref:Rieske domain-containing protein n=1 Tax=Nocardioides marinquilinus TaxID=1210400 RepID=A0ABP9PN79_9ACTN